MSDFTWAITVEPSPTGPDRHFVVLYAKGDQVEKFWVTPQHAEIIEEST